MKRGCHLAMGAVLAISLTSGCKLFQRTTQPVQRLIKQGSCIAIALPPITLTPERTAAERQLVGEDRELEKNGWLIASARSALPSAEGVPHGTESEEIRRYYEERGVLEFYEDLVREYRAGGVLGESQDGKLVPLTGGRRPERFNSPEETRRAGIVATEVNRARAWIRAYEARQAKSGRSAQEQP